MVANVQLAKSNTLTSDALHLRADATAHPDQTGNPSDEGGHIRGATSPRGGGGGAGGGAGGGGYTLESSTAGPGEAPFLAVLISSSVGWECLCVCFHVTPGLMSNGPFITGESKQGRTLACRHGISSGVPLFVVVAGGTELVCVCMCLGLSVLYVCLYVCVCVCVFLSEELCSVLNIQVSFQVCLSTGVPVISCLPFTDQITQSTITNHHK